MIFLFYYCFIYMLGNYTDCTTKEISSEDDLCGQLNALQSPVKLK